LKEGRSFSTVEIGDLLGLVDFEAWTGATIDKAETLQTG